MSIDIDTLGEFARLADEGADAAADALSRISSTETAVDDTGVTVVTERGLRRFADEYVGVTVGLTGSFPGTLLLACDRAGAERLLERSPDEDPPDSTAPLDAMDRSSAKEAGHIIADAYVEGFAAGLDGPIELTPPTYHDRIEDATLLSDAPGAGALVFESALTDGDAEFSLLTVPGRAAIDDVFTARGPDATGVPLHTLATFDRVVREGATEAAGLLSTATGIEATVDASRVRLAPVDRLTATIGDDPVAGTVFGLNDGRDGYLAMLFEKGDARAIADARLPVDDPGSLDDLHSSTIQELSSVLTSGFIDGWRDVFDARVGHTPPAFVAGAGNTVLDPVLGRIERQRDHTFVVEARLRAADREFACDVLALPADHRFTERGSLRHSGRN
ncbi:MAG: hypothetical protein ABEH90_11050 [Halolamina sp.]